MGAFNGWGIETKKYCDKMLYGKQEPDEGLKTKQKTREMHLSVQ